MRRIKYVQQHTSPSLITQITVQLAGCLTGRWKKKTENLTPGYLIFKVHWQDGPHQDRPLGPWIL